MWVRVPWQVKLVVKLAASRLPLSNAAWRRLGLFRHGAMDSGQYTLGIFRRHCQEWVDAGRFSGCTLLEIGPGDGVATGLLAHLHGAKRTVLIDAGDFANRDLDVYRRMLSDWRRVGLDTEHLDSCSTFEELCAKSGIEYRTEGLMSLRSLPSASVSFSFSHAVLEHVRRHEFLSTLCELRRVHDCHGESRHVVDLADHLGGGLNNLRFPSWIWESPMFANGGFYTNRLRMSEISDLCKSAGFIVEVTDVRRWDRLPIARRNLAQEFGDFDDEDLAVQMRFNVGRRSVVRRQAAPGT